MKPPELNRVAVWVPMKREELDVKTYESYQFMHKGIIQSANSLKPVVRYAKNYTKGKLKFSLCLISLERDTKKIEKFLDATAKKLKITEATPKFTMTDEHYNA